FMARRVCQAVPEVSTSWRWALGLAHPSALKRLARARAHPHEQPVGDRLRIGMSAAVPVRRLPPCLRAPFILSRVLELATIEAVLVQVAHDRAAFVTERDRPAEERLRLNVPDHHTDRPARKPPVG